MDRPQRAKMLGKDIYLKKDDEGNIVPSDGLIRLLIQSREQYDWPAGTGSQRSQQRIVNIESEVGSLISSLTPEKACEIFSMVSSWGGNNESSQLKIEKASTNEKMQMQLVIQGMQSVNPLSIILDQMCIIPGIRLVMASKVYRFCCPEQGASLDRHSSYFFNSVPVINLYGDNTYATNFKREWSTSSKSVSRIAIYNAYGHKFNLNHYCEDYIPLLNSLAIKMNEMNHYFRCAVTGYKTAWRLTDVEMAAYYWWAQNTDAR